MTLDENTLRRLILMGAMSVIAVVVAVVMFGVEVSPQMGLLLVWVALGGCIGGVLSGFAFGYAGWMGWFAAVAGGVMATAVGAALAGTFVAPGVGTILAPVFVFEAMMVRPIMLGVWVFGMGVLQAYTCRYYPR